MKLSKYIEILKGIQEREGDLDVKAYIGNAIGDARPPKIGHMKIPTERERNRYYYETYQDVSLRGDMVVKI